MFYGFLMTFYISLCFALMTLILIQKSKGSIGIGNLGGSMQMLFGGSGGQTLFQKITWIAGGLLMVLSLVLAIMKSSYSTTYLADYRAPQPVAQAPAVPGRHETPGAPVAEQPAAKTEVPAKTAPQ